jgi:methionyl-tRNA synthetase
MEKKSEIPDAERPAFPKRAVVTAGMPYGNKELHLGHIGGLFIHADTYARFLRDRLGEENVIFVSGTDCYGSPAFESHRQLAAAGAFDGTVAAFVEKNHLRQKEALEAYRSASASTRPRELAGRGKSTPLIQRRLSRGSMKTAT